MSSAETLAKALKDTKWSPGAFGRDWDVVDDGLGLGVKYRDTLSWEFVFMPYEQIIFDHVFAKALWGERMDSFWNANRKEWCPQLAWQYHLQQMVIAEDRIKYLAENMPQ